MRLIPLTQGQLVQVDNKNYTWLNQWKWYALKHGKTFYAQRSVWNKEKKKPNVIKMHVLIMNPPKGFEVDHQDHNGLNCQEFNMRNCLHLHNNMNKSSSGKSKYLGVYPSPTNKKWCAQIKINGIAKHLGTFIKEGDAAQAYNNAAKEHHKEYANLNIIE